MTHAPEETLLVFALEAGDDPVERAAVAAHLAECEACRERLARLRGEIGVLGGLRPHGRRLPPPRPSRSPWMFALARAAALLALGFALGMGAAGRARHEAVCVFPAYLTPAPPPDSLQLYAVPDGTEAGMIRTTSPDRGTI